MTTCREMRLQLAAYADDELGVDATIEVERHRAQCSACRREMGRQRHLTRALRDLYPVVAPPAGFVERTRRAVLGSVRPRALGKMGTMREMRNMRRMRAVAVLAAGVGLAWWGVSAVGVPRDIEPLASSSPSSAGAPEDAAPAVSAAAALHRRADAGALPLDVVSRDVAEVNGWLRQRLPFRGEIGAPGSDTVLLEGAAMVTLEDHPAGLVRYRVNGHAVSLFLLAEPAWNDDRRPVRVGDVDFRVFERRGLDLVGWSHAPLSYLLVSEGGAKTGEACATCHVGNDRRAIADFVAAVAGRATEM